MWPLLRKTFLWYTLQIMASNTCTDQWLKLELAELPTFTTGNMTAYFVTRLAGDGKAANDFKNLNKHAFPLFKAGHIQSILVSRTNNIFIIKCCCLPEMKKNIVYNIELKLQVQGQMATTKIHQCDFVIWTPKQCDTCYPKLRDFYFNFVLPEIVYPKHPDLPFDYSSINLYT